MTVGATSKTAGTGWKTVLTAEWALARALKPLTDHLRISDGRRETDPLHIATAELLEPLEQRREVRSAVIRSERVDFIDDDDRKP